MRKPLLAMIGTLCLPALAPLPAMAAKAPAAPRVEVVFAIDTTGSMGNLIEGAKAKIWFLANQIVAGDPIPEVMIGLVAYRDKGDEYVTRVYDLTDNIDQVHADLMGFQARGGGDFPENVNQALHDALHSIAWSDDDDVLRIIYLVGDAPPHPYPDVASHAELAGLSAQKGIIINTVQCGSHAQTAVFWQEISTLAQGVYLSIDQGGGVRHIPTPFDAEMGALNTKLLETAIIYGDTDVRRRQSKLILGASSIAAPAAADRAVFANRSGTTVSHDLLDMLRREDVALDDLDEDKIPETIQTMTSEERAAYLSGKQVLRDEILDQIKVLSAQRDEFIRQRLSEDDTAHQGFDYQVIQALRKQTAAVGIRYQ